MVKVIIAGGRDFNDYDAMESALVDFMQEYENKEITIISGMAKGADMIGYQIAINNDLSIEKYPANWDKYGKSAGFVRNIQMAEQATHLLAAWDGKSKGTKHMIDTAKRMDLVIKVISY